MTESEPVARPRRKSRLVRIFRIDANATEVALPAGWVPFAADAYRIYAYKE